MRWARAADSAPAAGITVGANMVCGRAPRAPGAGSPWLFSVAPSGPANMRWARAADSAPAAGITVRANMVCGRAPRAPGAGKPLAILRGPVGASRLRWACAADSATAAGITVGANMVWGRAPRATRGWKPLAILGGPVGASRIQVGARGGQRNSGWNHRSRQHGLGPCASCTRGWKPLAILGGPVGASRIQVRCAARTAQQRLESPFAPTWFGAVRLVHQGLEAPGYSRWPRRGQQDYENGGRSGQRSRGWEPLAIWHRPCRGESGCDAKGPRSSRPDLTGLGSRIRAMGA